MKSQFKMSYIESTPFNNSIVLRKIFEAQYVGKITSLMLYYVLARKLFATLPPHPPVQTTRHALLL